jgi:hypothetical protein
MSRGIEGIVWLRLPAGVDFVPECFALLFGLPLKRLSVVLLPGDGTRNSGDRYQNRQQNFRIECVGHDFVFSSLVTCIQ